MRIDIITIFPEFFESSLNFSILKKAKEKKIIDIGIFCADWLPDFSRQIICVRTANRVLNDHHQKLADSIGIMKVWAIRTFFHMHAEHRRACIQIASHELTRLRVIAAPIRQRSKARRHVQKLENCNLAALIDQQRFNSFATGARHFLSGPLVYLALIGLVGQRRVLGTHRRRRDGDGLTAICLAWERLQYCGVRTGSSKRQPQAKSRGS